MGLNAMATAICCCCCIVHCAMAGRIHSESEMREAIEIVSSNFYDNKMVTEKGESVLNLTREALVNFNFKVFRSLSKSNRTLMVKDTFQPFFLSRTLNGDLSDQMRQIIRDSLGDLGSEIIGERERDELADTIPKEIYDRVNAWNAASVTDRETKEIMVLGKFDVTPSLYNIWSFSIDSEILWSRLKSASLGVHLSNESRQKLVGRRILAELLLPTTETPSSAGLPRRIFAGKSGHLSHFHSSSSEIFINVSEAAVDAIGRIRESLGVDASGTLRFLLRDETSLTNIEASFVVMDTEIYVGDRRRRRRRRREAGGWPFDDPGNFTTEPEVPETKTHECVLEHLQSRYGRKSCCIMRFNYDLHNQPEIIAPKHLTISYCAGECLADAQVHTPHSHLLQMMVNSKSARLTHSLRQDMSLCCVPFTYRDFKLLVAKKNEAGEKVVEIRSVAKISAESCSCS